MAIRADKPDLFGLLYVQRESQAIISSAVCVTVLACSAVFLLLYVQVSLPRYSEVFIVVTRNGVR